VARALRKLPHADRKPTQQTEHDLELKRPNHKQNKKSEQEKNWTENPLKI
jgi:hypothetical protein